VPATVKEASALDLALRPLRPLLSGEDVTELCINRPGEAYINHRVAGSVSPWKSQILPWCRRLAKLIANSTRQRVDESAPLLSAWLPGGERVQIALPPATTAGCIAITIRRLRGRSGPIGDLAAQVHSARPASDGARIDNTAGAAAAACIGANSAFLSLAVKSRKTILVSGPTGSGKTT